MKAKETLALLDEYNSSVEELLKTLKQSILKVGRHSEVGNFLLDATWPSVYTLIELKSKYRKLKDN